MPALHTPTTAIPEHVALFAAPPDFSSAPDWTHADPSTPPLHISFFHLPIFPIFSSYHFPSFSSPSFLCAIDERRVSCARLLRHLLPSSPNNILQFFPFPLGPSPPG